MKRTNAWNRLTYTLWAPFYDILVGAPIISRARRRAIEALDQTAGERLLLVGIGTGADIPLLRAGVEAIGIDLTTAMLKRAQRTASALGHEVQLVECDAERMPFSDGTCDKALLTLILSVVPHARQCLSETLRILRPGGCAVVFDKFLPEGQELSVARRLVNVATSFFGTDINRRFSDITLGLTVEILLDEPGPLGGAYRVIVLRKPA